MASPQQQQINISDLDLPQLADVKRQLEEVGIEPCLFLKLTTKTRLRSAGTQPFNKFLHATETGSSEV